MSHSCTRACSAISRERAAGGPTPTFNSLTHEEQAEWLRTSHSWATVPRNAFYRAVRAVKILLGASLVLFCWQPVPEIDCVGGLEWGIHYRHEVTHVVPTDWVPCGDEGEMCPVYTRTVTGTATIPSPCMVIPDPAPGEVVLVRTTTIDGAGNEDCGVPEPRP